MALPIDEFKNVIPGLDSTCSHMALLNIHDTNPVGDFVPRAIFVKASDSDINLVTLKVKTLGGEILITPPLVVGIPHPIRITQIFSTGSDSGCSVWGIW